MTELEQLLITNLERMENEQQSRLAECETALLTMESRIQELERYAPQLRNLCEELEQLLRHLGNKNSF